MVPTTLKDAITVGYTNCTCSSESDITVIVFPDDQSYTQYNANLYTRFGNIDKAALDELVSNTNIRQFELGIVQCKTNWNDNAQIPMLWDMVYSAGGFPGRQIFVGANATPLKSVGKFSYSFVTVPTNKLDEYNPTSTPVNRVKNLSGGNYWGFPSKNGVAMNIKGIFNNYQNGFENNDIRLSLTKALAEINTTFSYFDL